MIAILTRSFSRLITSAVLLTTVLPLYGKESVLQDSSATVAQPQNWEGWRTKCEHFKSFPGREHLTLVFLGDSITESWSETGKQVWDKYYSHRQVANFGISGDRTQHLLWRIENGTLDGLHPRLVVVLIGTNNIKDERNSPEETAAGIAAVTSALVEKLPDSRILLLGVFPCGDSPACKNRQDAVAVNRILQRTITNERVEFLNLEHEFLEADGSLSNKVFPDYLHLTEVGYQRWAEALECKISAILGETGAK